jgi:thiosulfate reductase cytochrome b subunit
MRHSSVVGVTHWITAASLLALVVSGIAILLAHPRLYWGETGALGTPSLVDLPLPMILTGQSGWGRYLHFLAAWICVLTGVAYVGRGMATRHFSGGMSAYNLLQRRTYILVIFVLFPLMIWTGFAMSPALTSVFPVIVTALSGQQSARTIHFVVANLIVLFVLGHLFMVVRSLRA